MKLLTKNKLVAISVILVSLLSQSCSKEFRLANNITKSYKNASVMLVFPENIFLTNSKYYYWEEDITYEETRYAQKIDSSYLLRSVNANKLTMAYKDSMKAMMRRLNFKVFEPTEWDEYFKQPGRKIIVTVEQLELEEKFSTFYDEYDDGSYVYSKELIITSLQFNHWISVVYQDDKKSRRSLIYFEDGVRDEVDGNFVWRGKTQSYDYVYDYKLVDSTCMPRLVNNSIYHSVQNSINYALNSELTDTIYSINGGDPQAFWRLKFENFKSYPDYEFKDDYTIMNWKPN